MVKFSLMRLPERQLIALNMKFPQNYLGVGMVRRLQKSLEGRAGVHDPRPPRSKTIGNKLMESENCHYKGKNLE